MVVREGTEGPYTGNGGAIRVGTPHEVATEVSLNTAYGVERVVRDAFARASRRPRRKLTLVHKTNVLVHAGAVWSRLVDAVGAEYPEVTVDYLHVDAATIFLTTDPSRFDVIVTDNLFGDILTDLAAAITGGIGLAASGNINPDRTAPSMFEPVHGSAPDIAGPGHRRPDRRDPVGRPAARPPRPRRRPPPRSRPPCSPTWPPARPGPDAPLHLRRRRRDRRPRRRLTASPARTPARPGIPDVWRRCNDAKGQERPHSWTSYYRPQTPHERWASVPLHGHQHHPYDVADDRRRGSPRSWRTPASARTSPTTCSRSSGRRPTGWHDARVTPYGPLTLDPATAVLHYAQEIFEGMKAYRHEDGSIWTFRPEANAERMVRSCHRLALPALTADDFVQAVDALVEVDQRWVPDAAGEKSLYMRPFMFATRGLPRRAARPARHLHGHRSPAGAYFKGGVKPVTLWLTTDYTRAGRGGMGAAKTGGNYAASLVAQQEATEHGCDQVVFLDAQEGQYVEELGGMNMYFVLRRRPHRHPRDRHHPRGHHPLRDHRARRQARPPGRGAQVLHRRVARRRGQRRDRRDVRLRHGGRGDARSASSSGTAARSVPPTAPPGS